LPALLFADIKNHKMKKNFVAVFCLVSLSSIAQQQPTELDKSPMDMSYSPPNYPILKMNGKTTEQPVARVIYSRPQKAGRVIFGGIVTYNQVWRLGANEATEIEFFKNVKINGKTLPKGRYTLYSICTEAKWTIIFNTEKDIWGLAYNQRKDALRVDAPVQNSDTPVEALTMYFEDMKEGTTLNILWDNVKVVLPINF
jgi:hypothetical protein